MPERCLGILLVGGDFERAHTALMLAASAASLDRPVVLFATQSGLKALCRDWSGLEGSALDQVFVTRGVAGFAALREVLSPLGVRLMACVAGMQATGLEPDALIEDVALVGMPSFLDAVGDGQMLSI